MVSIGLRDVWYRYTGSSSWSLKGVSIIIQEGETVLVTGHNGSGKTTMLKIASLIYRPSSGAVLVNGKDFWALRESERTSVRRSIVYVHEKPVLLRGSVLSNVAYGLAIRGMSSGEAVKKCREVLEELGIWELHRSSPHKLSAGQAQLMAVARALVLDPEALLLDEPLAHLDSEKRETLINTLIGRQRQGVSIVISSHQVGYLGKLSVNKTVTLENGVMIGAREKSESN
ncbi:MAG: ABC transporter ATP-binding protein [Candidatus Freyarchaeota archaeon]|nr:ABC transporter ATP-binding protein [Candidatus Jordarchaeia archaeon]